MAKKIQRYGTPATNVWAGLLDGLDSHGLYPIAKVTYV